MKESNKLLGKKRKEIFIINKCRKNNHAKNSLIDISKLILDYIKQSKNKTGNQITKYIINSLQPENEDKLIEKNIQRRVYDSINVMNSLGIIEKNKQNIKYIPIKKNNNSEKNKVSYLKEININEIRNKNEKENDEFKTKFIENLNKKKQLRTLQKILINKYITLKSYENSLEQNKNIREMINMNYFFPNNILSSKMNTENYSIIKKEELKISSQKKILNKTKEIKRKKLAQELLTKLGKNNDRDKNNIFEKNKNTTKILKNKTNIGNKDIEKIKENNLNEDIVFNYLKNIKLFKKELFSICNDKE